MGLPGWGALEDWVEHRDGECLECLFFLLLKRDSGGNWLFTFVFFWLSFSGETSYENSF